MYCHHGDGFTHKSATRTHMLCVFSLCTMPVLLCVTRILFLRIGVVGGCHANKAHRFNQRVPK